MKKVWALLLALLMSFSCLLAVSAESEQPLPNEPIAVTLTGYRAADSVYVTVKGADGSLPLVAVYVMYDGLETPIQIFSAGGQAPFLHKVPQDAQNVRVYSDASADGVYAAAQEVAVTEVKLDFFFIEGERVYNAADNTLTVAWNPSSFAVMEKVLFGQTEITPADGTAQPTVLDVSSLIPEQGQVKSYDVTYYINEGVGTVAVQGTPFVIGSVVTVIKMQRNGNSVTVTLQDSNGNGLANKEITLGIGGRPITERTDANGQVVFTDKSISAAAATNKITAEFEGDRIGAVTYLPYRIDLASTTTTTTTTTTGSTTATTTDPNTSVTDPTTTTPTTDPTTVPTTKPTTVPTTTPTTVFGTTSLTPDGKVMVGAVCHNAVLQAFGMSSAAVTSGARLLLAPAYYAQLVESGMPLLSITAATQKVQAQEIAELSKSNQALKDYTQEQISFVTMHLQLDVYDQYGNTSPAAAQEVTVRLPVPTSMNQAEKIAVMAVGEQLLPPLTVNVQAGYIEFRISQFTDYAIIAYGKQAEEKSGFPVGALIGLIVGCVVLIALLVILYIFVIRKSRFDGDPQKPTAQKTIAQDGYISLMDLDQTPVEDPFKSQYVEKNSVLDDTSFLTKQSEDTTAEKPQRDIKDFDVEL